MTTSTSRSASAAPDRVGLPGPERRRSRTARAAPRAGRWRAPPAPAGAARGRAGRGSRRLPWAAGHYPQVRRVLGWCASLMQIVDDYLAELTRRMQEILGDELLAVYAGGSYALGAYEHGRSDVDVTAVVAGPLDDATKQRLVDALRHEALPCPASGLELVRLPARHDRRSATIDPGFELNLNTGAQHRLPRRLRPRRHRGLLVRDRPLDPARARDPAARPAARRAARADPARHARPGARGVDPLASRRRLAQRPPQHHPQPPLPRHRALDLEAGGAAAA